MLLLKGKGERVGEHTYTALRKDGKTFPVSVYSSSIVKNGQVVGFRGVAIDMTKRLLEEERIRRAHNLESLGILAGGIAHDFNNVLTGVIGNLAMLDMTLDKNSDPHQLVQKCVAAADRTRNLAQQLLTFAKGGAPVKKACQLEPLINETIDLSLHGSKTKPELRLADKLYPVHIDRGQIGQVLQNIILNGDQAMPEGGTLIVLAKNVTIEKNASLPLDPGDYVEVAITDQGIGMSPSLTDKIFEPYFSTKSSGHGLGLAISYSIIKKHGGYIAADSQQNVGTTITFYLPAANEHTASEIKKLQDIPHGSGRILLMDDEQMIQDVVSRMLESLGYEVETSDDGEAALRKYQEAMSSGTDFDMVIVDLTIPGAMGGLEAIDKFLEMDPMAKVVISSGYANDSAMTNFADHGFVGVIQKPVALKELAKLVKSLVEQ